MRIVDETRGIDLPYGYFYFIIQSAGEEFNYIIAKGISYPGLSFTLYEGKKEEVLKIFNEIHNAYQKKCDIYVIK